MERKSPRLQPFGCQMASTGAELDTNQNIMSPTGSLWKALLHRLQRSTLKTARVPQSDRSITEIQVVQLEHSSLHLCLSVHHQCPRKNAKNMKHAKCLLNKRIKRGEHPKSGRNIIYALKYKVFIYCCCLLLETNCSCHASMHF